MEGRAKQEKNKKLTVSRALKQPPSVRDDAIESILSFLQEGNILEAKNKIIEVSDDPNGRNVVLKAARVAVMQGLTATAADALVEIVSDGKHSVSEVMMDALNLLSSELCVTG